MANKKINFDTFMLSTDKHRSFKRETVYTNDKNSAELNFDVKDIDDLTPYTPNILLYMRDGSFFQITDQALITVEGTTVKYTLQDNEGKHGGLARTQLVLIAGESELASAKFEFNIESGLGGVASEVMIQDWSTLLKTARDYIDEFVDGEAARQTEFESNEAARQAIYDDLFETGVLQSKIDEKLVALETEYAPRITELTAQLAETKSFHASKFIGKLKIGEEATVVFLGDSTTEQNETTNGEQNHVGLLTDWLKEKYGDLVTVVNAGISGNSISQMLARLNKDVLSKNPDLVVVCSGINDAIGTNKITLEQYKSDYTQVIEMIIALSKSDIIIRTPNKVINPVSNEAIEPYVQASRAIATNYCTGLFDLYKQMETDIANGVITLAVPEFMNDGIHPNENGHQYIFENFKQDFIQTNTIVKTEGNYNLINGLGGFRQMNTAAIQESLPSAIKGKVVTFSTVSRALETEFIGSDFTLFYVGGPNTGQFIVYIDGVAQPVVDTYSPSYTYGNYAAYNVPSGTHKIKIENQPTKNENSTGNRIMIEGIIFKKEPLINDVITPHGFAFLNQSDSISLIASTNQYFIYNSVTDNSDIIDHNLATGDVAVKQTGLYDLLYTNRITADPESNVVVGYTKNGVIQKQAYDFFPSGTGKKSKTVDLVETLELVAGDVLRFFVNVGGTSPTSISNVKISIKK